MFVLEYRKTLFSGLYCLKEKVGKMAIFAPKRWVNPFKRMAIIRLFELVVFDSPEMRFFVQNIVKHIFLVYIPEKKKLEKWPF